VFQKDGAIVIAHENAVEPIIGEKLPTAVPNKVFKKNLRIELGGDVVKLTRLAPSHSDSMIIIEFPKHRAVSAVDFALSMPCRTTIFSTSIMTAGWSRWSI
jgi:hypothetical protein